jgi:hypothetical protein
MIKYRTSANTDIRQICGSAFQSFRGSGFAFGTPVRMIKSRMSSTRQTVIRGPSVRTGCGYRPVFTPAHHVERETGISAGIAGTPADACLPMICGNRR